jgi:hypothetical protein
MSNSFSSIAMPAVVSRPAVRPGDPSRYLFVMPDGAPSWTPDPEAATEFMSLREATRAAIRLPGSLRAFGLPLTHNCYSRA